MTAGIYTARDKLDTLILEKGICGGMPATTEILENYPGFPEFIAGPELMAKFKSQAQKFGSQIRETRQVEALEKEEEGIRVKTAEGAYMAKAVIIASGNLPKVLGIPGEKRFTGKGASYCATCDGPLYRGRDVVVVGCGNSGLQEGETLLRYVKSVTFVEYMPEMSASVILQERLRENEKARFYLNSALVSINGDKFVESVTLKDRATGDEKAIKTSGVFIYAGYIPNTKFVEGFLKLDRGGYIIADEDMKTSVDGIFAAGDVRTKRIRQIVTACGDGAISAITALEHIKLYNLRKKKVL